jgi:Swiss Army Knife protein, DSP-PTPase phosphatase domain
VVRRDRWRDGGLDRVPVAALAGQLWLCGKHVVGADPQAALRRIGGEGTIVCLNQPGELADRYPVYVDWLREHDGGRALWFPIPDLHAPALDDLRPLLAEIGRRLAAGGHVLVHCGAGIGRAGTVAVCVLMQHGFGRDDALAHVADHRPMAGPEVGAQRDLVDELAATLA